MKMIVNGTVKSGDSNSRMQSCMQEYYKPKSKELA